MKKLSNEQQKHLDTQPLSGVRWVPVEMVTANHFNPNSVASTEMGLLQNSILKDGYTQPVVTLWDEEQDKYVIVDGFHRYTCMKVNKEIRENTFGLLPIVVIKKDINDHMASCIRHNRARGSHSVQGMTSMVFKMLENGWDDADICDELGMEAEEIIRLKHITGFSKLFEDVEYSKEWKTKTMIQETKAFKEELTA